MSFFWTVIFPTDPQFVPAASGRTHARHLVRRYLYTSEAERGRPIEITEKVTDQIEFIDCGDYLERVLCPHCEEALDLRWWAERMTDAYASHYRDMLITVPCCHALEALDRLVYVAPCGFARYTLHALYPDDDRLTDTQLETVGAVLGCTVRQMWRHI